MAHINSDAGVLVHLIGDSDTAGWSIDNWKKVVEEARKSAGQVSANAGVVFSFFSPHFMFFSVLSRHDSLDWGNSSFLSSTLFPEQVDQLLYLKRVFQSWVKVE